MPFIFLIFIIIFIPFWGNAQSPLPPLIAPEGVWDLRAGLEQSNQVTLFKGGKIAYGIAPGWEVGPLQLATTLPWGQSYLEALLVQASYSQNNGNSFTWQLGAGARWDLNTNWILEVAGGKYFLSGFQTREQAQDFWAKEALYWILDPEFALNLNFQQDLESQAGCGLLWRPISEWGFELGVRQISIAYLQINWLI